jgi:hypothetical protein
MTEAIRDYPELKAVAGEIAKATGDMINAGAVAVSSDMPYKARYILEEVIKLLQEAV